MTEFHEWADAPAGDFAVIGEPVSHSLSPRMHAAAMRALALGFTYRAVRVPPGEVAPALARLASLGYRGVNVTIPLKQEAAEAARTRSEFAARCGAVNTLGLPDLHGINTDGDGFIETIRDLVPPGGRVLLLGAGGSARAIALSLAIGGYNVRVFNRNAERAHALVRTLAIQAEVVDSPALQDVQLIVNATSASLSQESIPLRFADADPRALAYDLVYGETPFLREAASAGLETRDGKLLLVAQGALSLEFWLGVEAPRNAMREAIA